MKVEDEIWLIEFKERFFDQLDEDAKGGSIRMLLIENFNRS